jgi:hypothetical protein
MTGSIAELEARFLVLRDAHDAHEVAAARGQGSSAVETALASALDAVRAGLATIAEEGTAVDEDRRAVADMRRAVAEIEAGRAAVPIARSIDRQACADEDAWAAAEEAGLDALTEHLVTCYSAEQAAVRVGTETMSRLDVLARLGREPEGTERRRLFMALEPVWRSIDGDGGRSSPYRRRLALSAERWSSGTSPIAENAVALGIEPASVEPALVSILEAWRDVARPVDPIEPWDWWHRAGEAERSLEAAIPLDRLRAISDGYHQTLGADPDVLGIRFDTSDRPGRPPTPVAFTTFGRRSTIEPWVFATYTGGGLGELTELLHETGHAIHIAAIRTRPAFADWPDSDALTEALAELTALDSAEPGWQQRWLGLSVPPADALRGRYADVLLDLAWAVLEIRLHADPERAPNDVWTEIAGTYLGIAPHPEWSWWAIRGQLAQQPGYMANYAIGAILAADMRAAIRAARGNWTAGDPGWYGWVSERIYRFGRERSSGAVLAGLLGRAPTVDALLAEIARIG